MEAKRLKSEIKVVLTIMRNKVKYSAKELAKLQRQIKSREAKDAQLQSQLEAKQAELDSPKAQQAHYGHDQHADAGDGSQPDEAELQREVKTKKEQLYAVRNELSGLQREAVRFDFQYTDPHRGFDRRKHGKLAKLKLLRKADNCRAIEICAGGRLYNVVVDTNGIRTARCAPNAVALKLDLQRDTMAKYLAEQDINLGRAELTFKAKMTDSMVTHPRQGIGDRER